MINVAILLNYAFLSYFYMKVKVLGEISIDNFIASYSSYGFNFLNLYSAFVVSIKVWGQMSQICSQLETLAFLTKWVFHKLKLNFFKIKIEYYKTSQIIKILIIHILILRNFLYSCVTETIEILKSWVKQYGLLEAG